MLQRPLHSADDAQQYRRVQALYLIQTRQSRTRRQVARVLDEMKEQIAVAFSERGGMALANIAALIHAGSVKPVPKPVA